MSRVVVQHTELEVVMEVARPAELEVETLMAMKSMMITMMTTSMVLAPADPPRQDEAGLTEVSMSMTALLKQMGAVVYAPAGALVEIDEVSESLALGRPRPDDGVPKSRQSVCG